MTHLKVSIIVPVYNMAEYVSRCIESLILQSHKNIEIIVVNDGSTDDSETIIQSYIESDSRVVYLKKENGGLSSARNAGIDKATGEYLTFVDSDDWVDAQFIEVLLRLVVENNAQIGICSLQKVNEHLQVIQTLPQLPQFNGKINLIENFEVFGDLSWFACNKIFDTSLFSEIRFTEGIFFEDIATIPKVLMETTVIANTPKYLYNYFERSGSISQSFNAKGLDMFTALSEVKSFYKNSNFANDNKNWKRFVILQGFYSFIAYAARVKDKDLQKRMFEKVNDCMLQEEIYKWEILAYKRFRKPYLLQLSLKKMAYYLYAILAI